MKVRNGFVSNSSSSSFIVNFETIPNSAEDVRLALFGNTTHITSKYQNYSIGDYETYNTLDIAKIVFRDIKNQVPNNLEAIADEFKYEMDEYGLIEASVDEMFDPIQDNFPFKVDSSYPEYELKNTMINQKLIPLIKERFKPGAWYVFEYSDNDGSLMVQMEHGDTFDKLDHVQISKH